MGVKFFFDDIGLDRKYCKWNIFKLYYMICINLIGVFC